MPVSTRQSARSTAATVGYRERARGEMRAARAAGWQRRDLWWEKLQESGNGHWRAGHKRRASWAFRCGAILARIYLPDDDSRQATSLANRAFLARANGNEDVARRLYTRALDRWSRVPASIDSISLQPRARSSLFHLRMEARHSATYRANRLQRLAAFVSETHECIEALGLDQLPAHRLYCRWRAEKPAVFDDARKLLAACLLVACD